MKRFLFAALLYALAGAALAEGVRAELSVGTCRYGRAQDGSWWSERYRHDFDYTVRCGIAALSAAPWKLGRGSIGWRVAWVDLGTAKADTDRLARDDEDQSGIRHNGDECNAETWQGCVGRWEQRGSAHGVSIGLLAERTHGRTTIGMEAGMYRFKSAWVVHGTLPAPGTCAACPIALLHWDMARAWHTTPYIGVMAEHRGWFAQLRRYSAIYASRAKVDPLMHGAIGGPLVQITAGYTWKF
jgi:hypothetical protein